MKRITTLLNLLVVISLVLPTLAFSPAQPTAAAQTPLVFQPADSTGQFRALLRLPEGRPMERLANLDNDTR